MNPDVERAETKLTRWELFTMLNIFQSAIMLTNLVSLVWKLSINHFRSIVCEIQHEECKLEDNMYSLIWLGCDMLEKKRLHMCFIFKWSCGVVQVHIIVGNAPGAIIQILMQMIILYSAEVRAISLVSIPEAIGLIWEFSKKTATV